MDSLTTGPAADTLERLFRAAESTDRPLLDEMSAAGSIDAAFGRFITAEAEDYQGLYRQYAEHFLSVSREYGRFLYMCARASGARTIVEFGTSFGVSTIHLAAAVRDNGGGRVISAEMESGKAEQAHENLREAGLADLVDIRVGDALNTLRDIEDTVDMVLLDGAFTLYRPVLELLEPRLRSGALVLGENTTDQEPEYLRYVNDPANGYLSLAVPDDQRGNHVALRTR